MVDHYRELVKDLSAPAEFVAADAARVARSIEQLPMASPVVATVELARVLDVLAQPEALSPVEREKCLSLARRQIDALLGGVRAQIIGESHPLPPAKADMAAALLALCARYGTACCIAVHEATAPAGRVSLFARARVAGLLGQALDGLAQALVLAYQLYETPPDGLWKRLHAVYGFAAARGLGKRETDAGGHRVSLSRRYVAALLLAMSNPYAFQRNELAQVVDACRVLARHAGLVDHLGGAAAVASDAGGSGPGYLPQERGRPERGELALNLEPLIAAAEERLVQTPPEQDAVALSSRREGSVEVPRYLLQRLVRAWRGSVERGHERMHTEHALDTVLGLHAVHQVLAGGQGFDSFQRQLGGHEIELGSQDAAAWTGSASTGSVIVTAVRVLDQSLGGYRLLWPAQQRPRVRIGELVGLAMHAQEHGDTAVGAPQWLIGLVRWLRGTSNGSLHVGIELLAAQARPAVVRGIDAGGTRGPTLRALILDQDETMSILLPSIGGRAFDGIEISAPADAARGGNALRHVIFRVCAVEPLGMAYYRVSLSDAATAAD